MRTLALGNGVPDEGDGGDLKTERYWMKVFRDEKICRYVMEAVMEVKSEWVKLRLHSLKERERGGGMVRER